MTDKEKPAEDVVDKTAQELIDLLNEGAVLDGKLAKQIRDCIETARNEYRVQYKRCAITDPETARILSVSRKAEKYFRERDAQGVLLALIDANISTSDFKEILNLNPNGMLDDMEMLEETVIFSDIKIGNYNICKCSYLDGPNVENAKALFEILKRYIASKKSTTEADSTSGKSV